MYNPGEVVNVPAAEIAIIVAQLRQYFDDEGAALHSNPLLQHLLNALGREVEDDVLHPVLLFLVAL